MRHLPLTLLFFVLSASPMMGAVALKDGKIIDARLVATLPAQDHYQLGLDAIECQNWNEAVIQFQILVINYPDTRYAREAFYYLGVGYFYLQDWDLANQNLSNYLQVLASPKHFRDVMYYKYAIAEKFASGARRHVFGWESMPCWIPSRELALSILDEVAAALPNDEIAAKALFTKGELLSEMCLYRESVEAFQTLIKNFPKNPLAPDSYVMIAKVYAKERAEQAHDPDLLGLAQVNLKRFRSDFPGDERIAEAEQFLLCMQEWSAQGLVDTGRFYEKTHRCHAATLYYRAAIHNFPQTQAAEAAKRRLQQLCPEEECLSTDS